MTQSLLSAGLLVAATILSAAAQTPLGTFAEVEFPNAIVQLDDGRVLINDGNTRIDAFSSNGTRLGSFLLFGISSPRDLLQLTDGRVLVSDGGEVLAVNADGSGAAVFADRLNASGGLAQLTDGRILIAEFGTTGSGRVSAYAPDGSPRGIFARDVEGPFDVEQLADSRVVVVANRPTTEFPAYAPDGTRLDPFATEVTNGGDILQLPDGRVLVSNLGRTTGNDGARVGMFSASGEYLGAFADEGLGIVGGLAYLSDGRVLVADRTNDIVLAYGVVPVASEPGPGDAVVTAIYPSPLRAGVLARLGVTLEAPGEVTITVFDATGREVSREVRALGSGHQPVEVGTAGLAAGVYAVRVSGLGVEAVRRLVVIR